MTSRLSKARDVFLLALRASNTLHEQCYLLSSVEWLHSDVRVSAAPVQSRECQVAALSVELVSERGDRTQLEESVAVAQRALADAQLA